MSDFFVHPQALCESKTVGAGTRIWAFAHVMPKAVIGESCNLGDHVFVENDVRLGDRVTVKNGVQLWDGVELHDDVFVGPNATFTNDPFPRSRHRPDQWPRTVVHAGASIGANATILPGITIGERAFVGAGSVVTKDVAPFTVVFGNPAQPRRLVDDLGESKLPFAAKVIAPLKPGPLAPVDHERAVYCVQGEVEVRWHGASHPVAPGQAALLVPRQVAAEVSYLSENAVVLLLSNP